MKFSQYLLEGRSQANIAAAFTRASQGTDTKKDIDLIATDAQYSLGYAEHVLKGPFPEGEKVIAKSSWCAYQYATIILHRRWPEGEPAIFTVRSTTMLYFMDLGIKYPEERECINNILKDAWNTEKQYTNFVKHYFTGNTVLMNKWLRYADNMRGLG